MSFTVVAERQGLSIFNRADTAADALDLAVARRRAGAESVYVRDRTWELVPATTLEQAAEHERGGHAAIQAVPSITVRVGAAAPGERSAPPVRTGAADAPPQERSASPVRTGRVRVFKAAGQPRSRG